MTCFCDGDDEVSCNERGNSFNDLSGNEVHGG